MNSSLDQVVLMIERDVQSLQFTLKLLKMIGSYLLRLLTNHWLECLLISADGGGIDVSRLESFFVGCAWINQPTSICTCSDFATVLPEGKELVMDLSYLLLILNKEFRIVSLQVFFWLFLWTITHPSQIHIVESVYEDDESSFANVSSLCATQVTPGILLNSLSLIETVPCEPQVVQNVNKEFIGDVDSIHAVKVNEGFFQLLKDSPSVYLIGSITSLVLVPSICGALTFLPLIVSLLRIIIKLLSNSRSRYSQLRL